MQRWDREQVHEQIGQVEGLLGELESRQDSPGGVAGLRAVQTLVDLYGQGLARMMDRVADADPELARELADDELVEHLLLAHDLHPLDAEQRIRRMLNQLGPALRTQRAGAELVEVSGATVRIRLDTGGGCGSTAQSLGAVIEEAVRVAAPEIEQVRFETPPARTEPAFIPLSTLTAR